jgi:ribosomal protein S9
VTLHLNRDAAFDLYAHASSGRITVDHPLTVTGTLSRHEMRGKVRGGGNLIEIRTSSGGITIR